MSLKRLLAIKPHGVAASPFYKSGVIVADDIAALVVKVLILL